jgi:phospholipid N-methyltransferase
MSWIMAKETNHLGIFADEVARNARADNVCIEGSARQIGRASGSTSYQFRASFLSNLPGVLTPAKTRVSYVEDKLYLHQHEEPESDVDEWVVGKLGEIKKYLDNYHSEFPTQVKGSRLKVGLVER